MTNRNSDWWRFQQVPNRSQQQLRDATARNLKAQADQFADLDYEE